MTFRVERSSADVRNGFYGPVRLLLFESGSEPVDAGVAVNMKRACAVGDGIPIRDNEDRRGRELRQDNEPPRQGAAALRHNKPLIEACGCAERCEGNCVLVCRYLVGRENQVK